MTTAFLFRGGTVLCGGAAQRGLAVAVEGTMITALGAEAERRARRRARHFAAVDLRGGYLAPGFIDLHTHGAAGVDFYDARPGELNRAVSEHYLPHGVTRLLVSLYPGPWREFLRVVERTAAALRRGDGGGVAAGLHLEGPFLDPGHPGALPVENFRRYTAKSLRALLAAGDGRVRTMTVAPERPRGGELIAHLKREGVVPAFGHSGADYRQAHRAVESGIRYVTHLFNAMEGIHHRAPGPVSAFLESPQVAVELIADGHHVDPAVMRWVARTTGVERLCLVSDSVSPCGLRSGRYQFAGRAVRLEGGRITQEDGTLAGSALTLDEALRVQVRQVGLPLHAAARAASYSPARVLGWHRRTGEIAVAKRADLVVLDRRLGVRETWLGGACVHRR